MDSLGLSDPVCSLYFFFGKRGGRVWLDPVSQGFHLLAFKLCSFARTFDKI